MGMKIFGSGAGLHTVHSDAYSCFLPCSFPSRLLKILRNCVDLWSGFPAAWPPAPVLGVMSMHAGHATT